MLEVSPKWLTTSVIVAAIDAALGVFVGLLFEPDRLVESQPLRRWTPSTWSSPLTVALALLAGYGVATLFDKDWRHLLLLATVVVWGLGFAVGIRQWTGVTAEAAEIVSEVAPGQRTFTSGSTSLMQALSRRRSPVFVSRFRSVPQRWVLSLNELKLRAKSNCGESPYFRSRAHLVREGATWRRFEQRSQGALLVSE